MPQFEVKVSDLISPRVAVILAMKNKFFRCDFTQNWTKLSKCNQCYQTKKSQGTNKKKNLEKKVFLWQFLRKNEKINENYPLLPYLKNWIIYFQHLVKIIDIRPDIRQHPAGYPVSGNHRISGSSISFAGLSGIRPRIHIRPNPRSDTPFTV